MRILSILLFFSIFISCDKNELNPDNLNDPVLFVKFQLNGVDYNYYAGEEPYFGMSDLLLDQDLRAYEFSIGEVENNDTNKYFIVNFVNHTKPYGDLANDVIKTFVTGTYDFGYSTPPSSNPYQLSTATLSWMDENDQIYTSFFYNQNNTFTINDVENHIEKDGSGYILVSAIFDCVLRNPISSDTVFIENGETRFIVELQ